ncbi:heptaprenyl diphosphate synthase component 1 [Paenibacillus polymyxa]|uniref:heptaprenyl diphosphate synthase component 1 n=1 Tax=Paenibacillus TaxID=44249 RepID=UPI00077C8867|nr:heptaprenyl diphosphate synthase component 1 [Paenibacillus polymyxa]AOK88701.1 heptaprenyl diphosphate synthase [Paenibacillus polymyxa]KYG95831.1 heptaprenyl diphosphate synthase [Paenibacillus polymyxa]MDY7989591.1 heptaprenyl diphosphate synthase component 1 [Paenibacillus polymyxa]MDY8116251.1 heptaprenyl diphosphate synthase component 1 [Paenibacillus polymyxa]
MKPYRVPQLARKYVEYDMIQQHTEMPAFPDSRTRLMFVFLNRNAQELHASEDELYALVTSLVQMGLDTHDMIDTLSGIRSPEEMRSRQLKVLAGDYFSSRFYQLLALAGRITAISKLSDAVCEVNAGKMSLYWGMKQFRLDATQYLTQMVRFKKELFLSFTSLVAEQDQEIWKQLLNKFALCDTLMEEWGKRTEPDKSRFGYMFWHIYGNGDRNEQALLSDSGTDTEAWRKLVLKYKAEDAILDKLRTAVTHIRQILSDDQNTGIEEFERMLEPFLKLLNSPHPVVREG